MLDLNKIATKTKERFWSKVDKTGGENACWLWQGSENEKGYGIFNGQRTNRIAWTFTYGPIPTGLLICHSCDVNYPAGNITYRKCCNPTHLWLGTNEDNMKDMVNKGRSPKGDRNGSRVHPENLSRGKYHHLTHCNRATGERNGQAKFTAAQVLEIRERYATGYCTIKGLAREKGVSPRTITQIIRKTTWKHL